MGLKDGQKKGWNRGYPNLQFLGRFDVASDMARGDSFFFVFFEWGVVEKCRAEVGMQRMKVYGYFRWGELG